MKLPCFGKPKPKGTIDMGQINGKPITRSRRLITEAAAKGGQNKSKSIGIVKTSFGKGRANQEQIYRIQ